jgi:hypothetical protein
LITSYLLWRAINFPLSNIILDILEVSYKQSDEDFDTIDSNVNKGSKDFGEMIEESKVSPTEKMLIATNFDKKLKEEELAGKVSNDLIAKQTAENKLVEDRLELERQLLKEKKDAQEIAQWNKEDLAAAEKMAKKTSENLESATAKNAMPGVDSLATAIGSVKVAGSADFSKQTELLNSAKKANDIATAQLAALKQIVDNSGGTA